MLRTAATAAVETEDAEDAEDAEAAYTHFPWAVHSELKLPHYTHTNTHTHTPHTQPCILYPWPVLPYPCGYFVLQPPLKKHEN